MLWACPKGAYLRWRSNVAQLYRIQRATWSGHRVNPRNYLAVKTVGVPNISPSAFLLG